jgi:hypothetical protein
MVLLVELVELAGRSSGRPCCVYIRKQQWRAPTEEHAAYGIGWIGIRLPQMGAAE